MWISYFRGACASDPVDLLIEENLVVTNDLILAELIPALQLRRQARLIAALREIRRLAVVIDWDGIVHMQVTCLRKGINGVGIPDLIIAQNAARNGVPLFSLDKHFALMAKHSSLALYGS